MQDAAAQDRRRKERAKLWIFRGNCEMETVATCFTTDSNGSYHGLAPSFFEYLTCCRRQKHCRRRPDNPNGQSKFHKYRVYFCIYVCLRLWHRDCIYIYSITLSSGLKSFIPFESPSKDCQPSTYRLPQRVSLVSRCSVGIQMMSFNGNRSIESIFRYRWCDRQWQDCAIITTWFNGGFRHCRPWHFAAATRSYIRHQRRSTTVATIVCRRSNGLSIWTAAYRVLIPLSVECCKGPYLGLCYLLSTQQTSASSCSHLVWHTTPTPTISNFIHHAFRLSVPP